MRSRRFDSTMMILAGLFTVYMLLSLFYLFTALGFAPLIIEQLLSQRVTLALGVSVLSLTIVALIAVLFGIPTSWMLAYKDFRNKPVLETLIVTIPHAFPPGVVGTTYLLMFTPATSPIGAAFDKLGITTIYVTHDVNEALNLGHRLAVMNQGRLEQCDTPRNLMRDPKTSFVARFMRLQV